MKQAHCPGCGSTDLGTNEDLSGTAKLTKGIWLHEDGEPAYDFDGYTEVHWDSSETKGYSCQSCGNTGPFDELETVAPA